jgi:hypothetical protein
MIYGTIICRQEITSTKQITCMAKDKKVEKVD